MKVISTNIAQPQEIEWNGKIETTGIYKKSVPSILLGKEDVQNDAVIDRKHHGGNDKSCYLYGANHYDYFKNLYPNLSWEPGMFGENLTISDFDETKIRIGDTFEVGEAIIQVSEPRQPCYKLGIKFNTQKVLKDFLKSSFSGCYVRTIKPGKVKPGDELKLIERNTNDLTVEDVFSLLTYNKDNQLLKQQAKGDPLLSEKYRMSII